MKKFILRHIDYILAFIFLALFFLPTFLSICNLYIDSSFDAQNFLVWDFASFQTSFFNVFYPYGILFYYKNSNMYAHLTYFFIPIVLFLGVLHVFKAIWQSKIFAYSSFILVFVFINYLTGVDVFSRYGIVLISLFLFVISATKNKKPYSPLFLFGIYSGIVFSFIPDQGIYIIVTSIIFVFLLKQTGDKKRKITKTIMIILGGVAIGTLPFLFYLITTNNLNSYFVNFINLTHISEYAKTPVFPSLKSIDNIFSLSVLLVAVSILSYKIIFKEKLLLSDYLIIAGTIVLFLLEQKSIIRSQDRILTFIPYFLLLFYASQLFQLKELSKIGKYSKLVLLLVICILIIFFIGLSPTYKLSKNGSLNINIAECRENYVMQTIKNYPMHSNVINSLKAKQNIYSFPSDPVFYNLNNQSPPSFFNIYDASFLNAQEKNIEYIKKNNVQYAIYNSSSYSTQDGVPDIVRGNTLFKFLIQNFKPYKKIENFYIFKKTEKPYDYFKTKDEFPVQKDYLRIDLGAIPKLEGLYKKEVFKSGGTVVDWTSIPEFNKKIGKEHIMSSEKIILLTTPGDPEGVVLLEIEAKNGLSQSVALSKCFLNEYCAINLGRLPLFFMEKGIKRVTIKQGHIQSIKLIEMDKKKDIW